MGCLRPAIWLRSDPGCGSLFQESLISSRYCPLPISSSGGLSLFINRSVHTSVALASGGAFDYDRCVRLSCAVSSATIDDGLARTHVK